MFSGKFNYAIWFRFYINTKCPLFNWKDMKISIIMCSLNSMPYIMASVESFKKQKYKNKELIIIYSKSDDHTDEYLKTIQNNNIKSYNFNGNIYASMNFGIRKSVGGAECKIRSIEIYRVKVRDYKRECSMETNLKIVRYILPLDRNGRFLFHIFTASRGVI